jgi:CelD/BcsL family acetyltransferase involved in cellulose biosynthesis
MTAGRVMQVAGGGLLEHDTECPDDLPAWQTASTLAKLRQGKLDRFRGQFPLLPKVAQRASLLDLEDDAAVAAMERLHGELAAAFGARVPLLQAWRESHPEWRSWVLGLHDRSAELRAVAPLVLRQRAGLLQIRFIGDQCPLAWRSDGDGSELAQAIGGALRSLRRPWSMHLYELPAGSAFTDELSRQLGVLEVRPGHDCPVVLVAGTRDPREVVSRNLRAAEAKARNRIKRAGLAFETRWIAGPRAIAERMPEVRLVHRQRDLQLRGASLLDNPQDGAFYDALVRRHLDQLELLEIRLDGQLGAYMLWLRNGAVRVVLDNRVAPRWTRYSAGLIANNEALRQAAADPAVEVLDWGPGPQRYKLQSANKLVVHEQVLAWSSRSLRSTLAARRMVGHRLSSRIRVGPGPQAAVPRVPPSTGGT